MTLPRPLMYDIARCTGELDLPDAPLKPNPCPQRDTCARYLSWVAWDSQIEGKPRISVLFGLKDRQGAPCEHYLAAAAQSA